MRPALRISLAVVTLAGLAVGMKLMVFRSPGVSPELAVSPKRLQITGSAMGTEWSVRFAEPIDDQLAQNHTLAIQTILDRIDREMSTWKADSDLSRFNAYRGQDWFAVPAELADIVTLAKRVSEESGGAFDITVGPIVNLWGFGPRTAVAKDWKPPTAEAIAAAKAHVGYQKLDVRLSPSALRKSDPELYVDLCAIAQGYACDRVADYLDSVSVQNYLADVSSEIRARGVSGGGKPWRVGIQEPTPDTRRVIRGVSLTNTAFSPSGDYQNFYEFAGVRYCHELDPRTGSPIQNQVGTAAVVSTSAAYADALATAMMVLGPDAGLELAEKSNLAVFFAVRKEKEFEITVSPAFKPILIDPATSRKSER